MQIGFAVNVPTPPSVNGLYANRGGGRHKTKKYKDWLHTAGWEVVGQYPHPVVGQYTFHLTLPRMRSNADLDNRVKASLDLIVGLSLVDGDESKFCRGVEVKMDIARPKGSAEIQIIPVVGS